MEQPFHPVHSPIISNDVLVGPFNCKSRVMNNQNLLNTLSFLLFPVVLAFCGCGAPMDGESVATNSAESTETTKASDGSAEEIASLTTKLTDAKATYETAATEIKRLKSELAELSQQKDASEKKLNEKIESLTKTLNATAIKMNSVAESTSQSQITLAELNHLLADYRAGAGSGTDTAEPKKETPQAAATAPAVVPHSVSKPHAIAKPRVEAKPAAKTVKQAPEQMPQSLKKK